MKRRVLSLALALVMLLSLIPMSAVAAGTVTEGDVTYYGVTYALKDGVLTVSGAGECASSWKNYFDKSVVTSAIIKNDVTSIGESAFSACAALTSVKLPDGLETIYKQAFDGCTSLKSVVIPNSVTGMGAYVFDGCTSLESAVLPNTRVVLTEGTFRNCKSLKSIVLPDTLETIKESAFYGCKSLESISIPDKVTAIGSNAFYGCSSLKSVTIPDGVTIIQQSTFNRCTALSEVNLPDGLKTIGSYAFTGCKALKTIVMPNSVTSIGDYCFQYCYALVGVTLSSGLSKIPEFSFDGCTSLESIVIPDGVKTIENYAFSSCTAIVSATIPESVTSIGSKSFEKNDGMVIYGVPGSAAESYAANRGIQFKDINDKPHTHSYTDAVTKPTCTSKGYTTHTCSCGDSYVDTYVDALGHDYKDGYCTRCGGKDPSYQPAHTHDTAVKNAKNATCTEAGYTGDEVCKSCGETVKTGTAIAPLGHSYENGECIRCGDKDPSASTGATEGTWSKGNVNYTLSGGVLTISGTGWPNKEWQNHFNKNAVTKVVIESGIEEVGHSAFVDCTSIKSVIIPDSVTQICADAFSGCTSLKSVSIPDSVTYVADEAFKDCSSLADINIGKGVLKIGLDAFLGTAYYNNEANWENDVLYIDNCLIEARNGLLGDYSIKAGTRTLANHAFNGCASLTSITVPDSVEYIGTQSLTGCHSLTQINVSPDNKNYLSVDGVVYDEDKSMLVAYPGGKSGDFVIPDGVVRIEICACAGSAITSVTIPDSLTAINDFVFMACQKLTSVTIPDSVESIRSYAFTSCSALTDVYYGGTQGQWNAISIGDANDCLTNATIHYNSHINTGASTGATSGSWTNNFITYTLDNGTLTISGNTFWAFSEVDGAWQKYFDKDAVIRAVIESGVTEISDEAFEECDSLTEIKVSPENTKYSSVDGVLCNKDQTEIVKCPEGKNGSFTIPDSVTSIREGAFSRCISLLNVTVGGGMTSISERAFSNCISLTSVIIPDNVTSISDAAFSNCVSLTSVTLPNGVTSIGDSAFGWCKLLASITIPDSVTSIGDSAFYGCDSLTDVYYAGTQGQWNAISISEDNDCLTNATIHYNGETHVHSYTDVVTEPTCMDKGYTTHTCACGDTKVDDYVNALGHDYKDGVCTRCGEKDPDASIDMGDSWTDENGITYNLDNGILTVSGKGECTAYWQNHLDKTAVKDVLIADGITAINVGSFRYCTALTTANIPDSVTSIGVDAFYQCTSLTSVSIPDGVTNIGDNAFKYCAALTDVYYGGTQEQWNAISIGVENDCLKNATIHCNGAAETLPGDINGDGKVNILDLIRLKKYLAGASVELVGSADVNGDGKVNILDLIRLKKFLAGADVELV